MRILNALLPAVLLFLALDVAAADTASETSRATPYKAPIVASLAPEPLDPSPNSEPRGAGSANYSVLDSPGGQLATTAAVFVFAMFLASLASKRA